MLIVYYLQMDHYRECLSPFGSWLPHASGRQCLGSLRITEVENIFENLPEAFRAETFVV